MKLLLKIVLSIFVLFILVSGSAMFLLSRGLETGAALEINAPDLTVLSDGSYTGEYKGGRWSNKIVVMIKDHKIAGIEVIDDMLIPREDIMVKLVDRVLEKQTTKVDTVAGATVSCKAYLKSIENALVN